MLDGKRWVDRTRQKRYTPFSRRSRLVCSDSRNLVTCDWDVYYFTSFWFLVDVGVCDWNCSLAFVVPLWGMLGTNPWHETELLSPELVARQVRYCPCRQPWLTLCDLVEEPFLPDEFYLSWNVLSYINPSHISSDDIKRWIIMNVSWWSIRSFQSSGSDFVEIHEIYIVDKC